MAVLAALTIMLNIVIGKGKEIFASIISASLIAISLAIPLVRAATSNNQAILRFPREKGYMVLLFAVAIVVVSYFVSVFAAQKKKVWARKRRDISIPGSETGDFRMMW